MLVLWKALYTLKTVFMRCAVICEKYFVIEAAEYVVGL